jgi:calpain-7
VLSLAWLGLASIVFFAEDSRITTSSSANKPLDNHQREDDVWERISSAHKFGDCLITISTSNNLSKEMEEATGLVPGHAYAVLNVCAAGTLRMLQVKNPWARRSWKGKFSSRDRGRWTSGLKQALGVSDSDFDKMDSQGIFWIDFADCREYFKSFFLNWNSALFVFRTTVHGFWPVSQGPKIDTYYIGACPQYSLKVQGSCSSGGSSNVNGVGTSIWILLSRHVVTKDVDPDSLSSSAAAALRDEDTYLTMHIYRDGKRLFAPAKPMLRGVYSSDPHVLARIDISESESKVAMEDSSLEFPYGKPIEYTVVLSQAEKLRDVYYTLSVYSTALPFNLKPCPPLPSNQLTVTGSWKAGITAGGNVNSRLFHHNPQYK